MGKDYYQILGVFQESKLEEINKAYRRLSLKYHPQLSKLDTKTSNEYFNLVSEAYEVLSDNLKRSFYDKYGEEQLKIGQFRNGVLEGGYKFNNNGFEIFEKFILQTNQLACILDKEGREDHGSMFGSGLGNMNYIDRHKLEDKVVRVDCTLNELYNGCAKKVRYTRQVLNSDGKTTMEIDEEKEIEIKKGFNSNSIVVFKGKGNQHPSKLPSDLVFEIHQLQHKDYQRVKDDLKYLHTLNLYQALDATTFSIITLDGRELLISLDQVVTPNTVKIVSGEGMPILNSNTKANLYIHFNIIFPEHLNPQARNQIANLLK